MHLGSNVALGNILCQEEYKCVLGDEHNSAPPSSDGKGLPVAQVSKPAVVTISKSAG